MRIAIWTGAYLYWERVHPSQLWDEEAPMMAGSEITSMSIAMELARLGHEVLLGCKVDYPESFGKLRICPLDMFQTTVFAEHYAALVSWDDPYIFRGALPHIPVKIIAYQVNHTICGVFRYIIDKHLHPSQWHAARYVEEFGVPEGDQVIGLTNGIGTYMDDIGAIEGEVEYEYPERKPYVLWCSSPDRGLDHLLRMWPKIQEAVPKAELHIYYDMGKWMGRINAALQAGIQYPTTPRALEIQRLLQPMSQDPHVTYHGGVSHVKLMRAMLEGSVLAYPCDPVAPTECFSMVMLEAIVAGLTVIASDADALPELWSPFDNCTILPLPVDEGLWVDQVVQGLQTLGLPGPTSVPERYTYPYIAGKWVELIRSLL